MPPAGLPRPDAATYDGADRLDRGRARSARRRRTRIPAGVPTFHRLNRTEYHNADSRSARPRHRRCRAACRPTTRSYGFDNIGDILGISPTLLERLPGGGAEDQPGGGRRSDDQPARPTRTRVAARPDAGLPSRRAAVRHARRHASSSTTSRSTANTRSRSICCGTSSGASWGWPRRTSSRCASTASGCRSSRSAAGVRGAGERRRRRRRRRQQARRPARRRIWSVRVPVKAGSATVGVTFLQRPSVAERGSAAAVSAQLRRRSATSTAASRTSRASRLPDRSMQAVGETPSRARIFICRPDARSRKRARARGRSSRRWRGARIAARSPTRISQPLLAFYEEGAADGRLRGGHPARAAAAARRARVPVPHRARSGRTSRPSSRSTASAISSSPRGCRSSSGAASPTTSCSTRRARPAEEPRCSSAQVRRMLADERSQALVTNFAGPVAVPAQRPRRDARHAAVPRFRRQPAPGAAARDRAVLREHHARGSQRARPARRATTPSSTSGWRAITAFRTSTAATSGASR